MIEYLPLVSLVMSLVVLITAIFTIYDCHRTNKRIAELQKRIDNMKRINV